MAIGTGTGFGANLKQGQQAGTTGTPPKPTAQPNWLTNLATTVMQNPELATAMGQPGQYVQDPMNQDAMGTGENVAGSVATTLRNQPGVTQGYYNQTKEQLAGPMAGEQYIQGQLPGVTQAGAGQQFAQGAVNDLSGMMGGANQAASYYDQFMQNRPAVDYEAGLDPYYQNAKQRAIEDVNQFAASRGAYGSSAALGMGNRALTDLNAEQANREADYRLRQLGEQRAWDTLGGGLAQQAQGAQMDWMNSLGGLANQAESMDIARQGMGLSAASDMDRLTQGRMGLGGELASMTDRATLDRLMGATQAGATAQTLGDDRVQRGLDNIFRQGVFDYNANKDFLDMMFGADQQSLDAIFAGLTGETGQNIQGAGQTIRGVKEGIGDTFDMFGTGADIYKTMTR